MIILYHLIGAAPQLDAALPDDDLEAAKARAKEIAENHPGRQVLVAKSIGAMTAPQTQAEWADA